MNSTKVMAISLLIAINELYNSVQSMEDINNEQKNHKSEEEIYKKMAETGVLSLPLMSDSLQDNFRRKVYTHLQEEQMRSFKKVYVDFQECVLNSAILDTIENIANNSNVPLDILENICHNNILSIPNVQFSYNIKELQQKYDTCKAFLTILINSKLNIKEIAEYCDISFYTLKEIYINTKQGTVAYKIFCDLINAYNKIFQQDKPTLLSKITQQYNLYHQTNLSYKKESPTILSEGAVLYILNLFGYEVIDDSKGDKGLRKIFDKVYNNIPSNERTLSNITKEFSKAYFCSIYLKFNEESVKKFLSDIGYAFIDNNGFAYRFVSAKKK